MYWKILSLVALLLCLATAPSLAAEIGTDWLQLKGGAGKVTIATDRGTWQWGLNAYIDGSQAAHYWGVDGWVRRYWGQKWSGLLLGYRTLDCGFGLLEIQAGYRFDVGDAFIAPGFGLRLRTDGVYGIEPILTVGLKL